MQETEVFPFSRIPQHVAMWVLIGVIMQSMLLGTPAWAATYHCHDEFGARVLTDNPAQLLDCTLLPSEISSSLNSGPSAAIIQAKPLEAGANPAHDDAPITDIRQIQDKDNPNQAAGGDIAVPLTKNGGSLVVRVMLNQERSAELIVDTGASMTVLSTQAAIDLGILGTTDTELLTVNTAGGPVQVNMNYLPSLTVGTAQATNVAVVIHDLPDIPEHIEGLLGMSFLKHFLVTLDTEHARLILHPKQQQ